MKNYLWEKFGRFRDEGSEVESNVMVNSRLIERLEGHLLFLFLSASAADAITKV